MKNIARKQQAKHKSYTKTNSYKNYYYSTKLRGGETNKDELKRKNKTNSLSFIMLIKYFV